MPNGTYNINMDNSNQQLQEALAIAEQLDLRVGELGKSLNTLTGGQGELGKIFREFSKNIKDSTVSIQKIEEVLKRANLQFDKNVSVLNLTDGSMRQNKLVLNGLLEQYELLSKEQGDHTKGLQALNLKIGELSNTIEKQENKLAKSRKVFDAHNESINFLGTSMDTLGSKAGEFGPEFSDMLTDASGGFNAMKSGISAVSTGFNGIGAALKTTGLGLLVFIMQSLVEYFTQTTDGAKKFKQILTGLSVIVNTVKNSFSSVGRLIINAFSNPVESLEKLGKKIQENIINRFKSFAVIYEGIKTRDFKKIANGFLQLGTGVKDVYTKAEKAFTEAGKAEVEQDKASNKVHHSRTIRHQEHKQQLKEVIDLTKQAEAERLASIARMAKMTLQGYAKEIADANDHFKELKSKYTKFLDDYSKMDAKGKAAHKKEYDAVNKTIEQQEMEHQATLNAITKKFQDEDVKKLDVYHKELNKIGKGARLLAIQQLNEDYNKQANELTTLNKNNQQIATDIEAQILDLNIQKLSTSGQVQLKAIDKQLAELEKKRAEAQYIADDAKEILTATTEKHRKDTMNTNKEFNQQDETIAEGKVQGEISEAREGGHESAAIKKEMELLKIQHDFAEKRGEVTTAIEDKYIKKKIDLENKLTQSRIHAGDKYIDAVLKNTKKDSAIYKAAFLAKKATAIADVIMNTKQAIIASFKGYAHMPFIGQALAIAQGAFIATQGAMSIADIAKQKPGFAQGGQYVSDGRGAMLSGYSRTDNTNAYLRSGEAVVVSEAMRNPWARNLVSAINVAHGGRDFSMPNPSRGYAIGGIFTDGGNANRYYSQPVNDQKDMSNTLAYQLINNFPPIYVDVKDVNNQQNILAQTVDRVNL